MLKSTVLLVRPLINRRKNAPFFLPLGLLCVAAPLRNAGYDVEIIDYEYLYRTGRFTLRDASWLADLCDPLIARRPMIVGITALADSLPICLLMGRHIKRHAPDMKVVIGGPGVFGTFPAALETYGDAVDYVCVNEGEACLTELADRLHAGEAHPLVEGLHASIGGRPVLGQHRHFADINTLPMPAYDLLPVPEYVDLASPRIFDVYLGAGCTYSCKFCVTATFWDREFRAKQPDIVLRELDYLHDAFGVTQVNFLHDNFANRRKYLDDFIDHFLAHNTRYTWGCAVRPDNVTRDQIARMRRAGCFNIFCGTDTGSRRLLRAMSKMPDASRTYTFFADCQAAGMPFEANTIIGYPTEQDGDLEDSLKLIFDAVAHGSVNSDVSVLQPLPGAAVTQDNMDHLVFVEDSGMGTFAPPDVVSMARAEPNLFTGFYFIRHGNQPFEWYVGLSTLVRFFTRHWFRTLYFLVNAAGLQYLPLLRAMMTERDPALFSQRFEALFDSLDVREELSSLASAVFEYDRADELLRRTDVSRQIENVYSPAESTASGPARLVLDLPHAVHLVLGGLPALAVGADSGPTSYLFTRDANGISTICLRPWQRLLWNRLEAGDADERFLAELAAALGANRPADRQVVVSAIEEATALFRTVLTYADSAASVDGVQADAATA